MVGLLPTPGGSPISKHPNDSWKMSLLSKIDTMCANRNGKVKISL